MDQDKLTCQAVIVFSTKLEGVVADDFTANLIFCFAFVWKSCVVNDLREIG